MLNIIQSPSPNFSNSGYKKMGVQIHKTLGLMPWTLQWLRNPISQASAHVLFARNGDVHELVAHNKRPWSAGRFNSPSERARPLMLKNWRGVWVKPGHYMLQFEFECLSNQTFTDKQYAACVEYIKEKVAFNVVPELLWEHQDTAVDKPDLDPERAIILEMLAEPNVVVPPKDKEKIIGEIIELLNQLK